MAVETLSSRKANTVPICTALLLVFVLALAFFLRTYRIELRPLHSDEGVNFHFLNEVGEKGIYRYSHENYHGPAYFLINYLMSKLTGATEYGLRSTSIFFGTLLPLLLLPLGRITGWFFVLLSALLIAVSPSLVFHSRYAIHEMLFVFSTTWLAVETYLVFAQKQCLRIYFAALALALLCATKETYVITCASLFAAVLALGGYREILHFVRENIQHFLAAFMLFFLSFLGFYSSGFRSFLGVREFALGVFQWVGRGTKSDWGHFKPFLYYTSNLIWPAEPYLLTGLVLLLLFVICLLLARHQIESTSLEKQATFGRYLLTWSLASWLIYSAIPYKTPWLVINLSLPFTLSTALALSLLAECTVLGKFSSYVLSVLLLIIGIHSSLSHNFGGEALPFTREAIKHVPAYGPGNPYSYVHTSPGMLEFIDDVNDYWSKNPQAKILVGTEHYWPLPFYFHRLRHLTGYFVPNPVERYTEEYSVIALKHGTGWKENNWRKKYYRFSDVQEADVYFKPELEP